MRRGSLKFGWSQFRAGALILLSISGRAIELPRAKSESTLEALLQLGVRERMPVGIALAGSDDLCQDRGAKPAVGLTIAQLLKGSRYASFIRRGVLEIRPTPMPGSLRHILDMRFERYGGISMTMQMLGVTLNGYIWSRLHPREGYAGDVMESMDAEKIAAFELRNASVEEIADHVVSLGSKGAWVLRSRDAALRIYGYNGDVPAIERVCY